MVDSGNNKVFIIPNDNEAGQLEDEEFSGPSEIAFDNQGNLIIVDTKNNRLQLVDANHNYYPVKVRIVIMIHLHLTISHISDFRLTAH